MTFSAIRLYNQRHHSYVWYLAASPQHDTIDIRCSWSFYPELISIYCRQEPRAERPSARFRSSYSVRKPS
jgi:hypothetical protein